MKNILFIFLASVVTITILNSSKTFDGKRKKENIKVGVALYSFSQHSFEDALNMADSCGVQYIEGLSFYVLRGSFGNKTMIDLSKEEILRMKEELKTHHLIMSSIYVGDAKDVDTWEKYFELGKEFHVKYFVCEPPKDQLNMIDSLADIFHIKIAIHNHDKPDGYWSPDSVLAAIKGHRNIGACADIGHWVISGLDPIKCLKQLDGNIFGLHLKDVSKSNADVIPGTGVINFVALTNELKRQHFDGYVQVECEHNMENNLVDVRKAINYFNNQIK